jgi:hypothetical protein
MAKKETIVDVRDLIEDKLREMERSLAWLSRQTKIPYNTMYSNFRHRLYQVSQENLNKINEVLNTDFTL